MTTPFRIAIAGLGTVGAGVVEIIQTHADLLSQRAGRSIEIVAVSARDQSKDRGVDLSAYQWCAPQDMANADVDAVVELVGGEEGVALDLVKAALSSGKHVVTANKAMMAHHGFALASLAEEQNVGLAYEAAVAGGIPIIKAMKEGFVANKMDAVYGILNGTCNYILTQMRETGRDFADVLKDAQDLGYAEADPSFDVGGIDAGHKVCLLASLAFGVKPSFDKVRMVGIERISAHDISFAEELGYRIKLLGIARDRDGQINISVEPALVKQGSPIAAIEDVYNAVVARGDFVDTPMLTGRGAGGGPTASAVVADIVDLAREVPTPVFGMKAAELKDPVFIDRSEISKRYFIRMIVLDQPGVIADVSAILRDHEISIESLVQRGHNPGQAVPVVMVTHDVKFGNIQKACAEIAKLGSSVEEPHVIRIEDEL